MRLLLRCAHTVAKRCQLGIRVAWTERSFRCAASELQRKVDTPGSEQQQINKHRTQVSPDRGVETYDPRTCPVMYRETSRFCVPGSVNEELGRNFLGYNFKDNTRHLERFKVSAGRESSEYLSLIRTGLLSATKEIQLLPNGQMQLREGSRERIIEAFGSDIEEAEKIRIAKLCHQLIDNQCPSDRGINKGVEIGESLCRLAALLIEKSDAYENFKKNMPDQKMEVQTAAAGQEESYKLNTRIVALPSRGVPAAFSLQGYRDPQKVADYVAPKVLSRYNPNRSVFIKSMVDLMKSMLVEHLLTYDVFETMGRHYVKWLLKLIAEGKPLPTTYVQHSNGIFVGNVPLLIHQVAPLGPSTEIFLGLCRMLLADTDAYGFEFNDGYVTVYHLYQAEGKSRLKIGHQLTLERMKVQCFEGFGDRPEATVEPILTVIQMIAGMAQRRLDNVIKHPQLNPEIMNRYSPPCNDKKPRFRDVDLSRIAYAPTEETAKQSGDEYYKEVYVPGREGLYKEIGRKADKVKKGVMYSLLALLLYILLGRFL